MKNLKRAATFAALAPIALLAAAPAMSDTLYASGGFVANGETGDFYFDNTAQNLFAATFTLSQKSSITGLGGVFTKYGDGGSIFEAIIAHPAQQTLVNASTLPGLALASTTFNAPTNGSDVTSSLAAPVTLGPGTYELVIGSGLFGATGQSGLATGMTAGDTLAQSIDGGTTWGSLGDNTVRVTVTGSPVPLPAALPLLVSGLAAGAGFLRRRRNTEVEAA